MLILSKEDEEAAATTEGITPLKEDSFNEESAFEYGLQYSGNHLGDWDSSTLPPGKATCPGWAAIVSGRLVNKAVGPVSRGISGISTAADRI